MNKGQHTFRDIAQIILNASKYSCEVFKGERYADPEMNAILAQTLQVEYWKIIDVYRSGNIWMVKVCHTVIPTDKKCMFKKTTHIGEWTANFIKESLIKLK